jgi:hypothetical protein
MKESIIQQCLDILKRDDIKNEMRTLFSPVLDIVIKVVNPYITITIGFVFLIFTMNLAILILLILVLRNKIITNKL